MYEGNEAVRINTALELPEIRAEVQLLHVELEKLRIVMKEVWTKESTNGGNGDVD